MESYIAYTLVMFLLPVFILMLIPVWLFVIPLLLLTIGSVRFWKQPVIRNICIVLALLTVLAALPALWMHRLNTTGGDLALAANFGAVIDANNIAEYRHQLIGIEDHKQFWKLRNTDANDCKRLIEKYGLDPIEDRDLFSRMSPPSWWPRSTDDYAIFEGDDGNLGSIEIWVPKNGSTVYLFKFSE